MKTERKTDFDRISLKVVLGPKIDASFTVNGGTYRFSSKGLPDFTHQCISKAYHQFVERSVLRVPPSIKFNMIENFAIACKDAADFYTRFTEHNLYHQSQSVPVPEEKSPTGRLTKSEPEIQNLKPKLDKKSQEAVDAIKKAVRERAPAQSKAASVYVYPEGMSAEDKKRYRAKMRAEARKQAAG